MIASFGNQKCPGREGTICLQVGQSIWRIEQPPISFYCCVPSFLFCFALLINFLFDCRIQRGDGVRSILNMPTTMARRTVNAPNTVTRSKQLVRTQQCTQAMQIMMTSTICTIAFLRELLPERYFDKRVISAGGERLSYNDFVDKGKSQAEDSQSVEGSTTTMVFKRGTSQRADQILQLLVSMIAVETEPRVTDMHQRSQAYTMLSSMETLYPFRSAY